jgi:methylphosphotriester-DNA--protein-cysteine methyltransferase
VVWTLGGNDDPNPVDDQNLSPDDRRRRRRRARYAEMFPVAKEALLKRRRDARASKRLFKTEQEVKESRRQVNINKKRRLKNNVKTTCILTPSPWQTLNGSQSF